MGAVVDRAPRSRLLVVSPGRHSRSSSARARASARARTTPRAASSRWGSAGGTVSRHRALSSVMARPRSRRTHCATSGNCAAEVVAVDRYCTSTRSVHLRAVTASAARRAGQELLPMFVVDGEDAHQEVHARSAGGLPPPVPLGRAGRRVDHRVEALFAAERLEVAEEAAGSTLDPVRGVLALGRVGSATLRDDARSRHVLDHGPDDRRRLSREPVNRSAACRCRQGEGRRPQGFTQPARERRQFHLARAAPAQRPDGGGEPRA